MNLAFNQISDQGVQYLASVLENKTERSGLFAYLLRDRHHTLSSLTILNLSGNQINDQGAQYLAHTLQKNQVR